MTNLPDTACPISVNSPRLQKALELCLYTIVAATALAHPLCLPDAILDAIYQFLIPTPLFSKLLPWLSCGFSPLVLKEGILLTLVAALLFIFSWMKIKGQYLGLERSALGAGAFCWKSWLRKPEVWICSIVLYYAISIAWSEVFQQSVHTWVLMAAAAAIFLVVRSMPAGAPFALRFMLLCIGCGGLLAGLALLQHLDRAPFLPASTDPRNRMSSLIGHNTGLSSWLMFPLSFSIYFALINRRIWAQVVATILTLFFTATIIAAESRAIWLLALIICLVLPWKLMQLSRRRIPVATALMAVTVVLLALGAMALSSKSNPLAPLKLSLTERLSGHVFNLDQLRRETRLRILAVSLTELVPANPLFGTGIGSFGWEYPKAQGDYFASHSQSRLGTTTKRTDLAHNDYLQILVETGLLGLALLMGGIFTFGRESLHKYREMTAGRNRALWWALTVPGTGVMLHALVDFPFHVAPIAIVTIVSLSLSARLTSDAPCSNSFESTVSVAQGRSSKKATLVGLLYTLLIFAWLPWGWQAMAGRVIASDIHYNSGVRWLGDYQSSARQNPQRRLAMLDRASRSFREAVVSNVFNGEAYEGQVTACINRGSFLLYELTRIRATTPDLTTTGTMAMERSIGRDARNAVSITENQLRAGGLRYHFTWYLLGRAWRLQWELEKHDTLPGDSKAYQNAVAALRQAVFYNPADSASVQELDDLLSQNQ